VEFEKRTVDVVDDGKFGSGGLKEKGDGFKKPQ
jgi:hypothetical protein